MDTDSSSHAEEFGGWVTFENGEGQEVRGTLLRTAFLQVVFEFYQSHLLLQSSAVLSHFQVCLNGQLAYTGRAIISNLVQAGPVSVCEVNLDEPGIQTAPIEALNGGPDFHAAYDRFFRSWQDGYRIMPEFKAIVADIEAFLGGVRQWLEHVELGIRARGDRGSTEESHRAITAIGPRVLEAFNLQHERFEELAYAIPAELRGSHQDFVRRHWHRYFLGSPFGYRTYQKPLGYAGDYEMMDMIHRNRPEGASLYDQLIHLLLVSQWPARSVRNRIAHLKENLVRESGRVALAGRRAHILNIGCGPAREIQDFLVETPLSSQADFTLLDFNEETLTHAGSRLAELSRLHGRASRIDTRRTSVYQLLRRGASLDSGLNGERFDLIYCAGLFDYLSDQTCRSLVDYFYRRLLPGGLVLVANMNDSKPFRNFIEFVLDWHLIYRDARRMQSFSPEAAIGSAAMIAEDTAVNLFLAVRDQR